MKHIISNPHNGSPVEYEGIKLAPGTEQEVGEQMAEDLSMRFGFLLMRVVPGKYNPDAKHPVRKIPGKLVFENKEHPDPDVPDQAQHTVSKKAAAPRKARSAKKKSAKK